MEHLLSTQKLTKNFGGNRGAFDINIDINPNEIIGFVGPNGAGKTTTMLMITGFTIPSSGSYEIFGKNRTHLDAYKLMNQIGVVLSDPPNFGMKTPRRVFKERNILMEKNYDERWEHFTKKFKIDIDKPYKKLSTGNKKKVVLALAMAHRPKLMILDEPTNGLDPLIQSIFFEEIRELTQTGTGILLSSHVLSEVESVSDRIVMIKEGKIFLKDTTKNIVEQAAKRIRIKNKQVDEVSLLLNGIDLKSIEKKDDEVVVLSNNHVDILRRLVENNIVDIFIERPTLEETFLESYR